MRTTEAYSRLLSLDRPVFTTDEAAVAWDMKLPAAAQALRRLLEDDLIQRLRHGVWSLGTGQVNSLDVLPVLTRPDPSYLSSWSALFAHGMIEQVPRSVHAVSLDRTKVVTVAGAEFQNHHIHPDLFGGYAGSTGVRAGTATPEKAIFDTVYLLGARSATVSLPELELPHQLDEAEVWCWAEHIHSARLRTIVSRQLDRALNLAKT